MTQKRGITVNKEWSLEKYRHPHICIAFTIDLDNIFTFFFFFAFNTFDQE